MIVFIAAIIQVIGAAFASRDASVFDLTPTVPTSRMLQHNKDTVTIDARDETQWTFFDFERRSTVIPPDTASWDIAFRRFDLISSSGARNLGPVPYDSTIDVPQTGFVPTTWSPDTVNTVLDRWYDYGFTTHLLTPQDNVYVVRTPENGSVKFQVLSYYCSGMVAGCITFRYEYAPPGMSQFQPTSQSASLP